MSVTKETLQKTLEKFQEKLKEPTLSEITKASYIMMINQINKRIQEYENKEKQN